MKKIIIIGGVAGGASAAARLRRLSEKTQIIVLERGQYISFANCGLPYYLSREIKSIDNLLLNTPEKLGKRFNLDIRTLSEVVQIQPSDKAVKIKNLKDGTEYFENYDELIISTGAYPFKPPIAGLEAQGVFTVRSIEDISGLDNYLNQSQAQEVCIAGGGFIGIEVAEQLAKRGLKVTIIEAMPQILAPFDHEMAEYIHAELKEKNINLILNNALSEIIADEYGRVKACKTKNGQEVKAQVLILGIGVKPENKLALEASIEVGQTGGIKVNDYLQTSAPHIWAIGDCIEVKDPVSGEAALIALGGPANKQGRIVADNIMGAQKKYKGTFGTFIIRTFALTASATGLNEKTLQKKNIKDYEVIYLHPNSHASYYPGYVRLSFKIIFSKKTHKILGAQIIGKDGVDKRIDIIATAMQAQMNIEDLAYLELAYSPQYGSAKDPINLAGMIAENILDGHFEQAHSHTLSWHTCSNTLPEHTSSKNFNEVLLDVRNKAETDKGQIENTTLNIPLDSLRDNLDKLDKNTEYIVYCQSGQRSYNATKILLNSGYKAKNLSGAYLTWLQNK